MDIASPLGVDVSVQGSRAVEDRAERAGQPPLDHEVRLAMGYGTNPNHALTTLSAARG